MSRLKADIVLGIGNSNSGFSRSGAGAKVHWMTAYPSRLIMFNPKNDFQCLKLGCIFQQRPGTASGCDRDLFCQRCTPLRYQCRRKVFCNLSLVIIL